jgi:hypothetical protein
VGFAGGSRCSRYLLIDDAENKSLGPVDRILMVALSFGEGTVLWLVSVVVLSVTVLL